MSIKLKSCTSRRTTLGEYNISRWTDKQASMNVYNNFKRVNDPDMREADNLLYKPGEMLAGTGREHSFYDASYHATEMFKITPFVISIGAFVGFLIVLRYLRK